MKVHPKLAPLLLALLAGLPAAVSAGVCYHVVDRGDAVVYRSDVPPFALSGAEFASGQRRLSTAGQHLFWFDTTSCPEEDELRAAGPKPVAADASARIRAPRAVARPGGATGTPGRTGGSAAPGRSAPTPAKSAPASGGGRY